jgi:DNA-binding beta-propeller fold protein YncE
MGEIMKKLACLLTAACFAASIAAGAAAQAQTAKPLQLVKTFTMPPAIQGHFDHVSIDPAGHRLYAAAESAHQVLVFDLHSGKYLRSIEDIAKPHAILIRPGIQRLYITDGGRGQLRIYNRQSYKFMQAIPLKLDSDSIAYDPQSRDLYVVNGGGDAHQTFSMISVIDTRTDKKLGDIRIGGDTVEAMAIDPSSNLLYANDPAKNTVVVINRATRKIEATWPVTLGRENVAIALDAAHHRLFVACRNGHLVVFNTLTGKQIQSMPIGQGVDDASFNPQTGRIYVQCGQPGATWVYHEESPGHYQWLGEVPEGAKAKNSALVPALHRYFVLVPPAASAPGRIDEFATR